MSFGFLLSFVCAKSINSTACCKLKIRKTPLTIIRGINSRDGTIACFQFFLPFSIPRKASTRSLKERFFLTRTSSIIMHFA